MADTPSKTQPWTVCGVPLTVIQIAAIKKAKSDGQSRFVISTTDRQSKRVRDIAKQSDAELKGIAAEMADVPTFAIAIRQRRLSLGITLDQLAKSTGITKASLSKIERGRTTNPTLDTLRRIGEGLGLELSVDYLANHS